MVKVDSKSDIEAAVKEFNRIFQNPVTHCCRFYTNYYLGEIKEFRNFDFELKRVALEQSDAFYNYSLYACAKEIRHIWEKFVFSGNNLASMLFRSKKYEQMGSSGDMRMSDFSPNAAYKTKQDLISHIEKTAPGKSEGLIKKIMLNEETDDSFYVDEESIIEFCEKAEDLYNTFTEPDVFLSACEYIFGHDLGKMWKRKEDMPFRPNDVVGKFVGWNPNYGGDGWESVAKTARLKDDFTNPSMVDLMWSVEHNNGKFIDKVPEITKEELDRLRDRFRDEWSEAGLPHDINASFPWIKLDKSDILSTVLPVALDFGKEGNIEPLFKMVEGHFDEFSDRQLRHIDLPRDEWFVETSMIQSIPI